MAELKTTLNTRPWDLGGEGKFKDDQVIEQDATRVAALAFLTVMSRKTSNQKLVPLTNTNPALTGAVLTCGANGGNIAAWQAVGDGAFKITVDGTELDITGLVFTAVTALTDIVGILQTALAGKCGVAYDEVGDVFTFYSLTQGLPNSTITELSAGSAGTDISGAGFLNGLSGTGTVTAATGEASVAIPAGIYVGDDIAAATVVAGDVSDADLLVGSDKMIDEDMIVLENSLTLESVIVDTGKTIRQELQDIGIYPRKSKNAQQTQPIN